MQKENDVNELTIEDIERFLSDEGSEPSTEKKEEGANEETVTETQAFARRLKDATQKARLEERTNVAKAFGFESYEAMQKAREKDLLRDKGYDPDEVSPIVEELVNKRLADDPRLKELDEYRNAKMQEWAKKELAELKTLTGGRVSKMDEVPKDVLELWKTKGSLKTAYLELKGEELIKQMQSEQNRSSTDHLITPKGSPAPIKNEQTRPFNDKEKQIYKMFNPDVTEEELSKMTKKL